MYFFMFQKFGFLKFYYFQPKIRKNIDPFNGLNYESYLTLKNNVRDWENLEVHLKILDFYYKSLLFCPNVGLFHLFYSENFRNLTRARARKSAWYATTSCVRRRSSDASIYMIICKLFYCSTDFLEKENTIRGSAGAQFCEREEVQV